MRFWSGDKPTLLDDIFALIAVVAYHVALYWIYSL